MTRQTAVLFCPGRGSYGRDELGFLSSMLRPGPVADALDAADAARAADDQPTVTALDEADTFRPGTHLEGRNAAELIYFSTLAHVERLREQFEIVAVAGNSLGWYTALPAARALTPVDGWQLVTTMARLQQLATGGQVLTTTLDEEWNVDREAVDGIERALERVNAIGDDHFVARSIRLGGHEVLAGTDAGVRELLGALPAREVGGRKFPFRLAGHGPFHTPLCDEVSRRATEELANLSITQPDVHLIDGRGGVHTPFSADPAELLHYTTTTQVMTTYDFTMSVRIALREFQPDVLLCAGPGSSLRAPVGHVVLRERWRELDSKAAVFESGVVRTG